MPLLMFRFADIADCLRYAATPAPRDDAAAAADAIDAAFA